MIGLVAYQEMNREMHESDRTSSPVLEIQAKLGDEASDLLGEEWDELLLKQAIPNPTCSAAWLRATIRLDKNAIPLVIVAKVQGELVGAGAFELKIGKGIRVARWLGGSGRPAIMPDLLIDEGYKEVAREILEELRKRSDVISLGPSRIESYAGQTIGSLGRKPFLENTAEGWVVDLPAPKIEKLRKKNASRIRRAKKEGVGISIKTYSEPRSIDDALGRLFSLHLSRWKGRNDISRFSKNSFYRSWTLDLVQELAERNQVRIVEVLENEQPVAMILGFLFGRGAVYHTPAVEPGSVLRGAGHVAMQAWVEAAQEAGAEVMSLGRGSGEPQGPKGALGPSKHPCGIFQIGSSPAMQQIVAIKRSVEKVHHIFRRAQATPNNQNG